MLVGSLLFINGGDIAPAPCPPPLANPTPDPPPNPSRLPEGAATGRGKSSGNANGGPSRLVDADLDDEAGGDDGCFDFDEPPFPMMLPDLPTTTDETLTTSEEFDLPAEGPFPKKSTAATFVVPSSRAEGGM